MLKRNKKNRIKKAEKKNKFLKMAVYSLIAAVFLSLPVLEAVESSVYTHVNLKGSVNPISARHIVESIDVAGKDESQFILLTIDTPGGLMTSLREIVQAILASKKPVIVYTYPKGAQAASAGGFIMLSAHVNAMAPGTEIGAMHPVAPGLTFYEQKEEGEEKLPENIQEKNVMGMKVLNDTLAFGRSIAQEQGRNEEWVEHAIVEAGSSTFSEAHEAGVVDIIADDIDDLLAQLDGRIIEVNDVEVTLNTSSIQEKKSEMSTSQSFLNFFADPQVLMLLLIVAIGGIALEFNNPGMIVPGAVGAAAFILFLMTINVLPVNIIGVVLIIAGFALLVLELFFTSYGLLTLAGLASFVGGSLMLFDNPLQGFAVSPVTIISMVILIVLIVFVIMRAVISTHKQQLSTGDSVLIGKTAVVKKQISAEVQGKVFLHGELWNAASDETCEVGSEVIVTAVDGMTVTVSKKTN